MKCKHSFLSLAAAVCTCAVLAQTPQTTVNASETASPVAWVYVSSTINYTNPDEVFGFYAYPNGSLRPIPGSPFNDDVRVGAVNGKYLYGPVSSGFDLNAYLIESNGSLRYAATTNILPPNGGCGSPGQPTFDHTGASLYSFDYQGIQCANNTFEAYSVVKSTGDLTFLGDAGDTTNMNGALTFIGNNQFAYGSDCVQFSPSIYGFQRNTNGSLTPLNISPAFPTGSPGWCPNQAAADPTNHVAIAMEPIAGYGDITGPFQLATYTASSSGSLTTTSTSSNMPRVQVGVVTSLSMSPSGKLLAVGGGSGLQIFHFNGASPITLFTGVINVNAIQDQMYWDNANHLYVISETAKKLWVYTITPTRYSQAPGSPFSFNTPVGLIVQPLPRY